MLFRTPKNQVSTPRPECGVEFDSSARAMNRSASKGSLMVHEYSHTTPAVKGILSFATFSERKHMLKTLKRKIALVAVTAVGVGMLSTVPAFAAAAVATAGNLGFKVDVSGIANAEQTVAAGATGTAANAVTRVGATLSVHTITNANAAPALNDMQVRVRITPAGGTAVVGSWIAAPAAAVTMATIVVPSTCGGLATCVLAIDADLDGLVLSATSTLSSDEITSTANQLLTVVNAGAPATIAWARAATTQLSAAAVDHTFTITPKDAVGVATILLDTDAIAIDISPVTGVLTSQVGLIAGTDNSTTNAAASISIGEAAANTTGAYTVTLNGNGSKNDALGTSGTTLPGTSYSMFAQLLAGTAAISAPATATYKRLSNTASLAGAVSFVDGTTTTTAVTSASSAALIATTSFKVKALDATGGVIEGATVTLSAGTVTGTFTYNSQVTGTDGLTATAMTFTPAAAGTGTIIATITTGTGTITSSIPVTVAAYGATVAAVAKTTAVNVDGTGFKAGTAPAYAGSLNITKVKVTITGLDASKAVLLAGTAPAGGTATSDVGLNPIADATGTVVSTWTLTSVDNSDTFSVSADADGATVTLGPITVVTVLFATANTGAISTVPATTTTSFAAPAATSNIVATVKNQFGVVVSGGVVVFTNSVKPTSATAQTTTTVAVGADGTATFAVVLGTVVGTYTYTAESKDVNGTLTTGTNSSTVTYVVTASGAPKTLTVTGGANTSTTTFRVLIDGDGTISTNAATATAIANTVTTNVVGDAFAVTTMTVSVTDDAGAGVSGVIVTATPDAGVLINSASAAGVLYSSFNEAGDLAVATVNGVATFFVTATKPGTLNVKFAAGSATATGSFKAVTNGSLDTPATIPTGRTITLDKVTSDVSGNVVQITANVKDIYGNPVKGVNVSGAITGTAGRFTGGGRTQSAVASDAAGLVIFEVTSNGVEAGTGTLTVSASEVAANTAVAGNEAKLISDDLTATSATLFTAASTKSATSVLTVKAASTSAASTEIASVKTDVATANAAITTTSAAVKTLATQVTVLQASVATLIDSLTTQIAALLQSVSDLTKAVAKMQADAAKAAAKAAAKKK